MGIRTDISSREGTIFSEDILKIEICGPDEDYLTVIDVPGIFRNPTEGVTTKDDIQLVQKPNTHTALLHNIAHWRRAKMGSLYSG
ncbi:hypothetical protein BKA66DRAFT_432765 [Pyrenochaeta sp. MPI-SDFR-AT-0127]|nr:hypothetical protein BKA66DRAFT_432765 [Pyrenochaeta sp. MPI-SDFR-AT-0127]